MPQTKTTALTSLTTFFSKNNYEVKMLVRNKSLLAIKKNSPRLFIEETKNGIAIKTYKELNDNSIKNGNELLEYLNKLNSETIFCKYYLLLDNKVCIETRVIKLDTETEINDLVKILKHDMQQIIQNNKLSKKFFV